jgi:hypothetical protein
VLIRCVLAYASNEPATVLAASPAVEPASDIPRTPPGLRRGRRARPARASEAFTPNAYACAASRHGGREAAWADAPVDFCNHYGSQATAEERRTPRALRLGLPPCAARCGQPSTRSARPAERSRFRGRSELAP